MGAVWERVRRDPARWVWWLGLGLVLLPFAVSAGHLLFGVGGDYLPVQDHSVIEMHIRDIGHHKVLVGLYSRADWSHPGPAQFYVLAPFYWLTGGSSIGTWIGALVVNAASVAGCAAIARRRGGTPVLLATLVGIALVMRTLGADILADPWNTYLPVLPYLLLLFLTWSMLCGDLWALPLATVVASFTAQTHVGFVALSLPLLIVGGVALTLPEVRPVVPRLAAVARRRSALDDAGSVRVGGVGGVADAADEAVDDADSVSEGDSVSGGGDVGDERRRRRRTAVLRAVLLSVGLFALMWLPPILDVLWEAPSNARQIIHWFQRADEGVHTLGDGWRVISAQFGATSEWFTGPKRVAFATGEPIAIYQGPPLPVVLFLVAAVAVVLWRRPPAGTEGARALVFTLGLGLVLGILGVARTVGPAYDYRLRWTWMLPVLAFVLLVWTAWRYLVQWRPSAEGRLLVPAALVALLILGVVNTSAAAGAGMPYAVDNEIMATITPPVLAAFDEDHGGIGGDGQVLVERYANHLGNHTYGRGLVLQLERHGIDARVTASRIRFLPESRNQTDGPVRARLVVAVQEQIDELRDDPDYRLLSIWSPLSDRQQDELLERIDDVQADFEAGRINRMTWFDRGGRLIYELYGRHEVIAYAVAVFIDERVGDASSLPASLTPGGS